MMHPVALGSPFFIYLHHKSIITTLPFLFLNTQVLQRHNYMPRLKISIANMEGRFIM